MKYYDEDQMGEIREALEKEILRWPRVTPQQMMGCQMKMQTRYAISEHVDVDKFCVSLITQNLRYKGQDIA